MINKIDLVELKSNFFAKLVKVDYSIEGLDYGVIYVKINDDPDWNRVVEQTKETFATSKARCMWLMKYSVEVLLESVYLSDDSEVGRLMNGDRNVIMPVFIPHEEGQYYLIGKINDINCLEFMASLLSIDAQNLLVATIPYGLSMIETQKVESFIRDISEGCLTNEWADTIQRLNQRMHSPISFRGKAKVNPMTALGDAAEKASDKVKRGELSYKEKRRKILDLPKIIKRMRDEDVQVQEKAMAEFSMAWTALSPHEQVLIVSEMMKEIKPIALKRIVTSTANREEMGAKTKYSIVVCSWEAEYKQLFDIYCKMCLFVKVGKDLIPLRMPKSSTVIYTMSLIDKVTNNSDRKDAIVDMKKNKEAYVETYKQMYDCNKDSVQKEYDELFYRNKSNPNLPTRSGRLQENYNDIETALAKLFKNLDEDYSPFLANADVPLALTSDKIELAKELLAIKIK